MSNIFTQAIDAFQGYPNISTKFTPTGQAILGENIGPATLPAGMTYQDVLNAQYPGMGYTFGGTPSQSQPLSPTYSPPPGGGGGGDVNSPDALINGTPARNVPGSQWYNNTSADPSSQMRTDINQKWDSYNSYLDSMLGGVGNQRQVQEGILQNSYNQSLSDLNALNTDNINTLATQRRKTEENQVKTLRDLAGNLQNQYQAGNVFLGTRGAADSSAANQYSYALNKIGSQQRGDIANQTSSIMNDINDREVKLKGVYTQEVSRLNTERQNGLMNLTSQFEAAQNQIREAMANGQLGRGTDLTNLSSMVYSNAVSRMNSIDQQFRQNQATLQTWAANNATNINQLKTNLQQVGGLANPSYSLPGFKPMAGSPTVDSTGNFNYYPGSNSQVKYDQWGNKI